MRHTLLPLQDRKNLRSEYYIRLLIVAFCMASVVFVSGSILLLPAYWGARSEEQQQLKAIADLKQSKDKGNDLAIAKELSSDLVVLEMLDKTFREERPSAVIDRVVALRKDIELNMIAYSNLGNNSFGLVLQGIAPTRNSLLSFKDRLNDLGKDVRTNLPISELAKNADIPFTLKITYSKP